MKAKKQEELRDFTLSDYVTRGTQGNMCETVGAFWRIADRRWVVGLAQFDRSDRSISKIRRAKRFGLNRKTFQTLDLAKRAFAENFDV